MWPLYKTKEDVIKTTLKTGAKKPFEKISVDQMLVHSGGNMFRLIRMAMNRALELSEGKPVLITNATSEKPTTIALEEIAQGKVVYVPSKKSPKAK